MVSNVTFAYLAGAIDSDGSIGIKRSTYAMRVRGDASQPVYSERISLKQVTPAIPRLLQETFGGYVFQAPGQSKNSRPLWGWNGTDTIASTCARRLLPYLRIKREQAMAVLELRSTKEDHRYKQISYWFALQHPDWRKMPMITFREVADRLGYTGIEIVTQAVKNGSLLALPRRKPWIERPRVPLALVDRYAAAMGDRSGQNRGRIRPLELIEWRHRLWEKCATMNAIGTSGSHPANTRSGVFAPAG